MSDGSPYLNSFLMKPKEGTLGRIQVRIQAPTCWLDFPAREQVEFCVTDGLLVSE